MITIPERSKQSPQQSPGPSVPNTPLQSPSIRSHWPSNSAASSTYFLNDDTNSAISLPAYPTQPAISRPASTYSITSHYEELDGPTACPTPSLDSAFSRLDGKAILFNPRALQSVNSFKKNFDPKTYLIETLDQHDDVDLLSPWKRKLYRASPLFTFLAVSAYFLYYRYRIHCTVYAQRAYRKTYMIAWLFIAAEGCVVCELYLQTPLLGLISDKPRSCSPLLTLPNAFY